MSACIFYSRAGCQVGDYGGDHSGNGTGRRRDDGCNYGRRQSGQNAYRYFRGVRTMTTNIVIEMGYAADLHRDALLQRLLFCLYLS